MSKLKARVIFTHDVEIEAEYGDTDEVLCERALTAAQADDVAEVISVTLLPDDMDIGPSLVATPKEWHPSEMDAVDPNDTKKNLERASDAERAAYEKWKKEVS